jgi:hypothetical protein
MAKYYSRETYEAADRVFTALIVAEHKMVREGHMVRARKLHNLAAGLELEFELKPDGDGDDQG